MLCSVSAFPDLTHLSVCFTSPFCPTVSTLLCWPLYHIPFKRQANPATWCDAALTFSPWRSAARVSVWVWERVCQRVDVCVCVRGWLCVWECVRVCGCERVPPPPRHFSTASSNEKVNIHHQCGQVSQQCSPTPLLYMLFATTFIKRSAVLSCDEFICSSID